MLNNVKAVCLCLGMLLWASSAPAAVEVGTGGSAAMLYVEWSDGYTVEFDVKFNGPSISGLGLFDVVESATNLTTVRGDFGWGVFVDGITLDTHSDIGFGGGENWWHYWTRDAAGQWTSPLYGVADRVLYDGEADGWIYGRTAITPEPASAAILLLGAVILRRRRTRGAG